MSSGVRVTVHAHAELARLVGTDSAKSVVVLPDGATVRDLVARLRLAAVPSLVVGVNGAAAQADTVLKSGDRIDLVTPMAGGRDAQFSGGE